MSFNSLPYIIFIIVVCVLHYIVRPKYRNTVLLAASYFFYIYIDPRYVFFLIFSTVSSYFVSRIMERDVEKRRKFWLILGIVLNIGLLFTFKYLNFLGSSISGLLLQLNMPILPRINLIIPIGISFYSFTVTGYLIDVYRKKSSPEKNIIDYALFVSFFPQLLSGPIERASNMLIQYKKTRKFNFINLKTGMTRFLWGLFKKMIIADQLAIIVNGTYGSLSDKTGVNVIFAVIAYSLQIYVDFSAYSDMAIGSARLLGLNIMENFDSPYLSSSVKTFWRRWHISLTSWFRDYLYIPLGGSRCSKIKNIFNILIVFTVSGLWHGASVTFIIWGAVNGLYLVIGNIMSPLYKKIKNFLNIKDSCNIINLIKGVVTFILISFTWIFFRADNMEHAFSILSAVFGKTTGIFSVESLGVDVYSLIILGISIALLLIIDILARKTDILDVINKNVWLTYMVCFLMIIAILLFGLYGTGFDPLDFVYFKF